MFSPFSTPTNLLSMTEDEFAETLKEGGWSEHAIGLELADLRRYRDAIAPRPKEDSGPIETNEVLLDAMSRRRVRRSP
jgi:hypothetical protein